MSKINFIPVSALKVNELKVVVRSLNLDGRSKLTTKEAMTFSIVNNFVTTVEADTLKPIVNKIEISNVRKSIKYLNIALPTMINIALDLGLKTPARIIDEVSYHLRNGVKLGQLVKNPEKYDVPVEFIPAIRYFHSLFDVRSIKAPTRGTVVAVEVIAENGVVDEVTGKLVVEGKLVRQSQSALFDVTSTTKDYFKASGDGYLVRCSSVDEGAKQMGDGTHIVFVNFNMTLEEGQSELSDEQLNKQKAAMRKGIVVNVDGRVLESEYMYQTPSQQRLVQATFVADMDAIEVLEKLGHDFRVYGSLNADGKWMIDMSKAIKRFGLSGTNTIASNLVKIGNGIEHFANGDLHLVGGTHTMRITKGAYAFVKTGKYKVYEIETGKFRTIDAAEVPVKLAAGDGQVFCDESVYNALVAEFGLDTSAWQIRITPFTKGLMIFVPDLKELYGADIVAFDTAVKGNYETLIKNHPNYQIQVRIALFNKPAQMSKRYTNMPYQFINTLPLGPSAYIEMADKHLDRAFELYENPKLMAEYLGLNVLSDLENLSDEDLSDDQREFAKNTLVSNFTEFLYSGDFTMKDPMMKKYAKDIIENVIKQWTFGSIPVEGHYRFMVQDPYAILETKVLFDECEAKGEFNPYKDIKGDIIIPSHIGLPAETVFMVDDNDEFMMDGKKVVFNRNPKISYGETALATTHITEKYALARKKFKKAFVNLAIFSVHDFNTFKQGGADNDGDTSEAKTEEAIVNAVEKSIDKFPAILDISVDKDGKFIEGCPFSNPYMDKNEFKREFSDVDYNRALARELHELSKTYVLRTLEPNDIGLLTNYATKILDAVTKLTIAVNKNQTVDGNPLSESERKTYLEHIVRYLHYTDILRLAQGWEIDKAKHGGYYKLFMDLSFIDAETPEQWPFFATEMKNINGVEKKVWINPDWMAARKGSKGKDTGSLIQIIRNHVLARYENEIVAKFKNLDPVSSDNNLTAQLALGVQKPNHYADVLSEVRIVRNQYKRDIVAAIQNKERALATLAQFAFHNDGRKLTDVEKALRVKAIEESFSNAMDSLITITQGRMSALEIELKVAPAVLGLAAYELTYAENNNINRNNKKGDDPTAGLSFPWTGAKYQLLSAVRLVSGKDMRFTNVEKVAATDLQVRIGNLQAPAEVIKNEILNKGYVAVWNQQFTDVTSPLNGYFVFNVYAGKNVVGTVFADKAHVFSGHAQWVVNVKDVSYSTSKDGSVRSMTLTLDGTVNPFVKA